MRLDCQEIGLNGLPRRIGLLKFEPLAFFGKRRQRLRMGERGRTCGEQQCGKQRDKSHKVLSIGQNI